MAMSFEQERSGYPPTYNSYSQPPRPIDTTAGNELRGPSTGGSGSGDDISRRLDIALHSDQGPEKLQNRLKQSIYSARDLANFLKERCALEDRYAQGFKRLIRNAAESIRRPEARQGTFLHNFDETLRINDRLADNTLSFASRLHTVSEELRDMADTADKGRKHWKHNAADAERRVAEAENARQKAKDRFNTAAEQYERVRTGERQGGKFGLKNKSPAQQEEALKEKADMLDQDYTTKAGAAQAQRDEYENNVRPQIVQALRDLVDECDAHLAMQMAKLASMSEKHVVSNGMAISPIKGSAGASGPEPRGLRQIAQAIDNRKDFNDYILDGTENIVPFNPRSSRNTEPELMHSPVQPDQVSGVAYNAPQSHGDSTPPQLPRTGGPDAFSSSFDNSRPGAANRASYGGGQQSTTGQAPPVQPQQSPYTPDARPPLDSNPSIPAFDRAQPAANGARTTPTAYDKPPWPPTTGPLPQHAGRGQSPSRTMPGAYTGRGESATPEAPRFSSDQGLGREQGPPGFGSQAGFGRGQSSPYADRTQGPAPPVGGDGRGQSLAGPGQQAGFGRGQPLAGPGQQAGFGRGQPLTGPGQPLTGPGQQPGFGRGQQPSPYSDRTQGPPTPSDLGMGRGQSPTAPGQQPGFGRGQPSPYSDRSQDLAATSPIGRGQPAGRGLPSQQLAQPSRPTLPPNKPVFGVHLDELFRRDGTAVPTIVFQCIEAVDLHGINIEGIYRISGSSPTVMQLKSEFDHDSNLVDLKDPRTFNNDIASVATLLKNFLRDLPDPLLTATAYHSFIQAAQYEDNVMRRDAMHQYINSLPDPNYATLRVLVLHLHRMGRHSNINKMDMKNLAIVFGPTVMGGGNVHDAGWQTKVMETILHHTYEIFDPDE